jgi:ABC-type sugar transport system ATPase subunit
MTTTPLRLAEGLDLRGHSIRVNLDRVLSNQAPAFEAQRPYRNGVVVYGRSLWGGNGFGTDVTKVAVRDGEVVGIYESGRTHMAAVVAGVGGIHSDRTRAANGEVYTTRTALSKWISAIKAL